MLKQYPGYISYFNDTKKMLKRMYLVCQTAVIKENESTLDT